MFTQMVQEQGADAQNTHQQVGDGATRKVANGGKHMDRSLQTLPTSHTEEPQVGPTILGKLLPLLKHSFMRINKGGSTSTYTPIANGLLTQSRADGDPNVITT